MYAYTVLHYVMLYRYLCIYFHFTSLYCIICINIYVDIGMYICRNCIKHTCLYIIAQLHEPPFITRKAFFFSSFGVEIRLAPNFVRFTSHSHNRYHLDYLPKDGSKEEAK